MIAIMTTVRRDGRDIDLAVGELATGLIEARETTGAPWPGTFTREERAALRDDLDRARALAGSAVA